MFKTKKFQLIELIINATVTGNLQQTFFQSQPQLQSITGDKQVYVKAIEVYTKEDILFSPLTSGNPVASAIDLANATITFQIDGKQDLKYLPLTRIHLLNSNSAATPNSEGWLFLLKNIFKVDWTQTFIQTIVAPGGSGTTTPPFSYLIGVHYSYMPDAEDIAEAGIIKSWMARNAPQGNATGTGGDSDMQ